MLDVLTEIDHVAIAVNDLEAAIDYYHRAFGAEVEHREVVESDGVEEALLKVADSYVQLLTPTRPDSPVAKALEKRGEGLHHVGYRVDDCAEALAAVVAAGGKADRPGAPARVAGHDGGLRPPEGQLRHPHRARAGVTDRFYLDTLARFVAEGVIAPTDRFLVSCGGPVDHDTLLAAGFADVVITNLDERMDVYNEYEPYEWHHEDAEALTAADDSVDWGLVHHGLHHCASPHRALGELLRVGRKGAIVFEARDSLVVRAGVRLGVVEEYEVTAVAANQGRWGGVRNGPVPNHVYRWTEREVRKTVRSLLPGAPARHPLRLRAAPADRPAGPEPAGAAGGGRRRRSSSGWRPARATSSRFVVSKNVRPQPWLREG